MAETSCNGTLSASDGQLSGLDFEPGYIAISPFAAPGSGFSTQVIASSIWVYLYSAQEWIQLPWSEALVAQPNYGSEVSIGPTSGSPWLTAAQVGNIGYVYIYAEYYWWSGIGNGAGQWVGPAWVPTTEYIEVTGIYSRSASSSCYIGWLQQGVACTEERHLRTRGASLPPRSTVWSVSSACHLRPTRT
jgi:hypothetical protein